MNNTTPLHDPIINTSITAILRSDDRDFAIGLAEMLNTFLADDGFAFRFDTAAATLMDIKIAAKSFIATFLPVDLNADWANKPTQMGI